MSSQQDWHIPLHQDVMTLGEALASLPAPAEMLESPLMLRLQRDPELSFLGRLAFRVELDQHQHDCIHVLLGRGLLPMDQAFVLGFTIASSKKGSLPEHKVNAEIGRHFNTNAGLFSDTEYALFKEGIKLAYLSYCAPLENFDFRPWLEQSLRKLREAAGLEAELLLAYYAVEKHRYPHASASQRLLPTPAQAAGI